MNLQPGDLLIYSAKSDSAPWCCIEIIQSVNVHDGYVIVEKSRGCYSGANNKFFSIIRLEGELNGGWRYSYTVTHIPAGEQVNIYLQELQELLY